MRALDVAQDTTGKAHAILAAGFGAVGLYLRPDRSSLRMVQGLAEAGLKRFSVYEKGFPTSAEYFTLDRAELDARAAVVHARHLRQPEGSQIFLAVDYDAAYCDIEPYFVRAREIIRTNGYLCSVYSSGYIGRMLKSYGFAHSYWLAQSHGWNGYNPAAVTAAAIVQGSETKVLGMDVDLDLIKDTAVLW